MTIATEDELKQYFDWVLLNSFKMWNEQIESRLKWGLAVAGGTLAALLASGLNPDHASWQIKLLLGFVAAAAIVGVTGLFIYHWFPPSMDLMQSPLVVAMKRLESRYSAKPITTSEQIDELVREMGEIIEWLTGTGIHYFYKILDSKDFNRIVKEQRNSFLEFNDGTVRLRKLYRRLKRKELLCNWQTGLLLGGSQSIVWS